MSFRTFCKSWVLPPRHSGAGTDPGDCLVATISTAGSSILKIAKNLSTRPEVQAATPYTKKSVPSLQTGQPIADSAAGIGGSFASR